MDKRELDLYTTDSKRNGGLNVDWDRVKMEI